MTRRRNNSRKNDSNLRQGRNTSDDTFIAFGDAIIIILMMWCGVAASAGVVICAIDCALITFGPHPFSFGNHKIRPRCSLFTLRFSSLLFNRLLNAIHGLIELLTSAYSEHT